MRAQPVEHIVANVLITCTFKDTSLNSPQSTMGRKPRNRRHKNRRTAFSLATSSPLAQGDVIQAFSPETSSSLDDSACSL
ncbi:hypothetical protein Y032_0033g2720 [Ancylostoma ceylanicum]|nr:hypothetical protein Y032_0033g2720 [Ancylostoma ceylanicum]